MTPRFKVCDESFRLWRRPSRNYWGVLNISPFDQRLRRSREQALELFERAWPLAVRKGMMMNEKDAAPLYIHCLAKALSSVGVEVPNELLPMDDKIIRFLQKELS